MRKWLTLQGTTRAEHDANFLPVTDYSLPKSFFPGKTIDQVGIISHISHGKRLMLFFNLSRCIKSVCKAMHRRYGPEDHSRLYREVAYRYLTRKLQERSDCESLIQYTYPKDMNQGTTRSQHCLFAGRMELAKAPPADPFTYSLTERAPGSHLLSCRGICL